MIYPTVRRHVIQGNLQWSIRVISGEFPHPDERFRMAYIKTSIDPIGLESGSGIEYVWAELIDVCPLYIIKVTTTTPVWDSRHKRIAVITKSADSFSINNNPSI